ncbi:MAG: hypothetical protein U0Q22_14710 [Acidimicrobiales bacterium]
MPDGAPPVVVSRPFSYGRWELATWVIRPHMVGVVLALALYAGILVSVPLGAAVAVGFGVLITVQATRRPPSTYAERRFEAWADGSFRVTLPASALDGNVGTAWRVRRSRRGWAIMMSRQHVIVVPIRAVDAEGAATIDRLVADRRRLGPPLQEYTADTRSTLPFDAQLAPLLTWQLRRVGPRLLLIVAITGALLGVSLHRTALETVAILAGFAVGSSALALGVIAVVMARTIRQPAFLGQRIVIGDDGLDLFSTVASSHLDASVVRSVDEHRTFVVVRANNPFLIPDTAFRDPDHRRAFVDALRAIVPPTASSTPS